MEIKTISLGEHKSYIILKSLYVIRPFWIQADKKEKRNK